MHFINPMKVYNALWGSWKTGSKVVNFDKLFLRGIWPKISQILHRAALTPPKPKYMQILTNVYLFNRKTWKKPVRGVCSSQDWSQKKALAKIIAFYKTNILSKHPEIAKKWVQSLKNRIFCYFFKVLLKGFKQNSMN